MRFRSTRITLNIIFIGIFSVALVGVSFIYSPPEKAPENDSAPSPTGKPQEQQQNTAAASRLHDLPSVVNTDSESIAAPNTAKGPMDTALLQNQGEQDL